MSNPTRMTLYLKETQFGGRENIKNILKHMHTTKYNILQNREKNITITYTPENTKNYLEDEAEIQKRNIDENKKMVVSQYYASGGNTVVFEILINNETEKKILKVIEINAFDEENYLNKFINKYNFDNAILQEKNITHVFYYGLIKKENDNETRNKSYFYIITKKYETNFKSEKLDLKNKIRFISSLMIILKEMHKKYIYFLDLKLINLGYEIKNGNIKCIIIDYDIDTLQQYYINGKINIETKFRGNTFFPNYAIEFVKNLDEKCVQERYYLMGSKYEKMDILGLADVIISLFFEPLYEIDNYNTNSKNIKWRSQLRYLNEEGSFKNRENSVLNLRRNQHDRLAFEIFFENTWLKNTIYIKSFVDILIPLQKENFINNTIKNLLYSKNNPKSILAPNYNDILSYEEIINVWFTMQENINNNIHNIIDYTNYERFNVRTVSPEYENHSIYYTENIGDTKTHLKMDVDFINENQNENQNENENETQNITQNSKKTKIDTIGGKKYILKKI